MARRSGERKAARSERGARKGRRAAGSGEKSSYRQKIRAKRLARGKNAGCTPKLFALLLPFAAAGAFIFLRS
jgi:ribosomal protein L19E